MSLTSWEGWLAWAGIVLPLIVIAWSAFRYTAEKKDEREHRRFEQFFSVTDKIGQPGGSITSKIAAVYELRRFPEYADVIVRLTDAPDIQGTGRPVEQMKEEFRLTRDAMQKHLPNG